MCVLDHFYACVYTQGFDTQTTSQHNILTQKNSQVFLVLRTGFEPQVFGSQVNALPTEPSCQPH